MITTLLFDLGGTLHSVIRREDSMRRFSERLIRRLSDYGIVLDTTPESLAVSLHENAEAYKHLSEKTLTELPAAQIWNEHYLREFHIGEDRLAPIAEELGFLYDYDRLTLMRKPRLKETIAALHDMGIRMGIVSNIISTSLVPHVLKEYGIDRYMECIVMPYSLSMWGTREVEMILETTPIRNPMPCSVSIVSLRRGFRISVRRS